MGIYQRTDSPYWWKKYDIDPETKRAPRKPTSTRIYVDAPTKEQRAANKKEAETQYHQDVIDIRHGIATNQLPAITFREYAKHYLEHVTAHVRAHESETSIINILVKVFGELQLTDLTIDRIRQWRTVRAQEVKKSTVNQQVGILSKMLTRAIPKYLESNPLAARVPGTNKPQLERLYEDEFEARAFTKAEFARFITVLETHREIHGTPCHEGLALVHTAIETLVRRGSLLKLTWQDYRDDHFVTKNTKVSKGRKKAPQTKPISDNMRTYFDLLPRDTPKGLIFASHHLDTTAKTPSWKQHVKDWFQKVCALAEVPFSREDHGVTFHSFRHTGATWYLQAGYSVKAVMQLGGWTNAQLFLDTYVHVSAGEIASMTNSKHGTRNVGQPKATLTLVAGGKAE